MKADPPRLTFWGIVGRLAFGAALAGLVIAIGLLVEVVVKAAP